MNKVTIITYDMMPYSPSFGGCQRMYYLHKHLNENNVDCRMIASSKEHFGYFGKEKLTNVTYIGEKEKTDYQKSNGSSITSKIKKVIAPYVNKTLRFTNNEPSNIVAIRAMKWISANKNEIISSIDYDTDFVIISGPPFCLFSLGKLIKQQRKTISVIYDYRDPWNIWNGDKFLGYILEKRYLKHCDKIVVTNPVAKERMLEYFNQSKLAKIHVIYNGYSDKDWDRVSIDNMKNNDKPIISFIGSIDVSKNSFRDATCFLEVAKNHTDRYAFRFIGIDSNEKLQYLKTKYPYIEFIERVDHIQSLEYMLRSDFLLTLHTAADDSGKFLIQGKFFDYIRSDKQILSIGKKEDLTNKMIDEFNLGVYCENDFDSIDAKLKELSGLSSGSKSIDINNFSRTYQNSLYLEVILSD